MSSFQEIRRFLQTVRRHMRWCNALEGGAVWLASIALMAALGSIVLWLNEGEQVAIIRHLLLSCAFLVSLWLIVRRLWVPFRSFRSDDRVARHLENQLGSLQNDIISAVQLERSINSDENQSPLSRGLAMALAKSAAIQLRGLRAKQMAPWRRCLRRTWSACVAMAILAGLISWQPQPFVDGGRILLWGVPQAHATSQPIVAEQRDIVVRDITYTLVFPVYTERKNEVVPNSTGDIRVLQGTRIQLKTSTLFPAQEASLIFSGPETRQLRLDVDDRSSLKGEFTATDSERYRFQLITPDGRQVVERVDRLVDILPDQTPRISFIGHKHTQIVHSKDIVPLRYDASDDYGISAIDLVVKRKDADSTPVRHRIETPNRVKDISGRTELAIQELALAPGEKVECWLEIMDNNSLSESPQMGRSSSLHLTMHSNRNQHKAVLTKHQHLIESLLDLLADRLESRINDAPRPPFDTILASQTQIATATEHMLQSFQLLLNDMVRDPLMDNSVHADMSELFSRHKLNHDAEIHQIKTAASLALTQEKNAKSRVLAQANDGSIALLEADIILIEGLWQKLHQAQLVDRAKDLVEAHHELTRLIEEWKKAESPEARLKIQQQISTLIKQVQKLMSEMQQGARPTPLENMNMEGLESTGEITDLQSVHSSLQEMQKQIQSGDMDAAMALADKIGTKIQGLASSMESELKQLQVASSPKGRAQMRRALSQLRTLVHRQNAVHRKTETVHDKYRDKLADVVRRELIPGIGDQLRELNRLTKQLNQIRDKAFHATDRRQFHAIQQSVENLKETLTQEDISQAVRMAKETKRKLDELSYEVRYGLEHLQGQTGKTKQTRRLRQNLRSLNKARPIARRVESSLEKMLPEVDELLNRQEQRTLDKLGKKQQRVVDQLERFQSRLEALEETHPGLGRRLREQLTHTKKHMNDAKRRLSEHRPAPAVIQSRDALDRLGKAVQELENARANSKRARGEQGLLDRDRVAIPDADQYQVPKEFRDELLRAIKERAPQRYRTLIDRYYEVLVQ